jgi:hypothetical protein
MAGCFSQLHYWRAVRRPRHPLMMLFPPTVSSPLWWCLYFLLRSFR